MTKVQNLKNSFNGMNFQKSFKGVLFFYLINLFYILVIVLAFIFGLGRQIVGWFETFLLFIVPYCIYFAGSGLAVVLFLKSSGLWRVWSGLHMALLFIGLPFYLFIFQGAVFGGVMGGQCLLLNRCMH